jgi:hypothetical protein
MRVLALALATCLVPSGVWVKTTGEEITVPCPTAYETPQRLPRGCGVVEPGIWYSVSAYRSITVELAELRAQRDGLLKERALLKEQLSKARGELILCTAAPDCPSNLIQYTTQGALIGAALSFGGCMLWTR